MAKLDKLAVAWMTRMTELVPDLELKSLDEFLLEYGPRLTAEEQVIGQAILDLYPEYGGENDPD